MLVHCLKFQIMLLHLHIFHSYVITDDRNKMQYSILNTQNLSYKMEALVVDLDIFH